MIQMLGKLRAANVATHSAVALRPDALAEREFLDALLAVTKGNLFRLGPYAYALDLRDSAPEMPSAGTFAVPANPAAREPESAEHILASLSRQFGEGSVALTEITEAAASQGRMLEPQGVLLVEALAGGAETAIRRETPACRAVIDAEYAVATARMAAEGVDAMVAESARSGPLAHRLDAIEERIATIAERTEVMAGQPVSMPGLDRMLDRLSRVESGLNVLLDREPSVAAAPASTPAADTGSLDALSGRIDSLAEHVSDLAVQLSGVPSEAAAGDHVMEALAPVITRLDARIAEIEAVASRLEANLTERSFETG